jgi:hypothetical protein
MKKGFTKQLQNFGKTALCSVAVFGAGGIFLSPGTEISSPNTLQEVSEGTKKDIEQILKNSLRERERIDGNLYHDSRGRGVFEIERKISPGFTTTETFEILGQYPYTCSPEGEPFTSTSKEKKSQAFVTETDIISAEDFKNSLNGSAQKEFLAQLSCVQNGTHQSVVQVYGGFTEPVTVIPYQENTSPRIFIKTDKDIFVAPHRKTPSMYMSQKK